MSERGTFITQHINCNACAWGLRSALSGFEPTKFFCIADSEVFYGEGGVPRITAGRIGGLYAGEELHSFEDHIAPVIAASICHPVRVAVLAADGERVFIVQPRAA